MLLRDRWLGLFFGVISSGDKEGVGGKGVLDGEGGLLLFGVAVGGGEREDLDLGHI